MLEVTRRFNLDDCGGPRRDVVMVCPVDVVACGSSQVMLVFFSSF